MKKIFYFLSTILLFIFSFIYTNNLLNYFKNKDPLMREIKEKAEFYYQKPINAIITNHYLIPGKKGKIVNTKKSYNKMKSINSFNENFLVLDDITPSLSFNNHYDKLIISNKENFISLILVVDNNYLFQEIDNILKENNVFGNILDNNYNIENTNFVNKVSFSYKKGIDYCLTNIINSDCVNNHKYSLLFDKNEISNYYLENTKNNLDNHLFLYHFKENNVNELSIVLRYFKSNNYQIVSIDELIKE